MPATRSPKGTYVRSTPDWFTLDLCTVGGSDGANVTPANSWETFSLYNNDTASRNFYIYAVSLQIDTAYYMVWDMIQTAFGTQLATARYVHDIFTTAPGVLGFHQTPYSSGTEYVNPDIGAGFGCVAAAFNGTLSTAGFPLWIIKPGYSLRVGINYPSTINSVNFWYVLSGSN